MTEKLYLEDAYQASCVAVVLESGPDGVVLDRTVFYARGGGQPGDTGRLVREGSEVRIVDTVSGRDGRILHLAAAGSDMPAKGEQLEAVIDWDRRYAHMRMHTGLHLLGVALPYGVTGGNITAGRSRLDFDLPDSPDKATVEQAINEMIESDHRVSSFWIGEDELEARPDLIRTLSVRPPRGAGRIRLLQIAGLDLQPCGGTHVRGTGEIGRIRIPKIEKKGRRNRRVYVEFADE
jgi:misacylated tRNA(Ala) deacylase